MYDEHDDSINGQLIQGTLTSIDDSGPQQLVAAEGIYGQRIGEAVRLQHFGATGVPPIGAQGVFLLPGGRFDRAIMLGLEHGQYRPTKLPGGAKAIYDQAGNIIKLLGQDGAMFDFTGRGWSVTFKGGTILSDGDDVYHLAKDAKVYVGSQKSDTFSPVLTVNGPAKNLFAAS